MGRSRQREVEEEREATIPTQSETDGGDGCILPIGLCDLG
jgi:hypothetical protein